MLIIYRDCGTIISKYMHDAPINIDKYVYCENTGLINYRNQEFPFTQK